MRAPFSRTLPDLLREQAERRGDAVAVVARQGRLTYAELLQRAECVAGGLRRLGVGPGQRVALLVSNRLEWLDVLFGAGLLGAEIAPISTFSTRTEIAFVLADCAADVLVTLDRLDKQDFLADLTALIPELAAPAGSRLRNADFPRLRHVVLCGTAAAPGTLPFADLIDGAPLDAPLPPGAGVRAAGVAMILYSSGSSNFPKAIRFRHDDLIENAFNIGERQGLTADDRVFLPAPLFWSFGSANALPATFTHGGTLVVQERFEAGGALAMIEQERCTAIYTLPSITGALLRHPDFAPARVATLRTGVTIGGAQDVMAVAEKLGVGEICNIYGASETYGNCCVTDHAWPLAERAVSQGAPLPGVEVRIRSLEDGTLVPAGEIGAVEVRGYLTPGYTGKSAGHNADSFTEDGFFRTGDTGMLDAAGRFVFVGRHSEMIKRAGINVSPAEVEDVLLQHPDIAAAAVVGVPDTERGEAIVAFVVAERGRDLIDADVLAHCRGLASRYKVPDQVVLQTTLPTTATGKLLRRELRQVALAMFPAERAPATAPSAACPSHSL